MTIARFSSRAWPVFLLLLAMAISFRSSGATAPGLLVVANKGDKSLSIVDPKSNRKVATVAEDGVTGHEVITSPDGRFAYVPIYGNSGVGKPGTDGQKIDVIDIAARKVIGGIDFGHAVRPHCPKFGPRNGLLYVTTELDNSVSIIDPHTLKIVGAVPTGQTESHMLAITHDGRRGYTANVGPGTVSVLNLDSRKTIAVIPVSGQTQRISLSIDDRLAFTADQTKPQLAVIDTATNKVKTWVPLPAPGYGTAPTRDGRWLVVAVSSQQSRRSGSANYEGRARDRRPQRAPGSAGAPRRQDGVCFLRCQPQNCRHRHRNLESGHSYRCREGNRRAGLGCRAVRGIIFS